MRSFKWFPARSNRTNRPFSVLGAVFLAIVAVILIAAVFFLVRFAMQNRFGEQTSQPSSQSPSSSAGKVNVVPGTPPAAIDEGLHYETFYDLFSGVGWIDEGRTTLFQNLPMTAFLLPPKYSFERTTEVSAIPFLERQSDGSDERCLPAQSGANHCLKQKDLKLFFDGSPMPLPGGLSGANVVDVSIGNLDTRWLIGVVAKNSSQYNGWVFTFDGRDFLNANRESKELFGSQYGGRIGFGGSDGDWLAVYSAYDGKAVHVKNGSVTDISDFFGIRVMANGFEPAVGWSGSGLNRDWYVWSRKGAPKLVKLFQNGTDGIKGAVDLSGGIIAAAGGVDGMIFAPAAEPHCLIAKVTRGGTAETWKFTDNGFDVSTSKEVVSKNLTDRGKPVVLASIAKLESSDYGGKFELFLSNDDVNWTKVSIGETVKFSNNKDGDKIIWRLAAAPPESRFSSPYFGQIEIRYAWRDK